MEGTQILYTMYIINTAGSCTCSFYMACTCLLQAKVAACLRYTEYDTLFCHPPAMGVAHPHVKLFRNLEISYMIFIVHKVQLFQLV